MAYRLNYNASKSVDEARRNMMHARQALTATFFSVVGYLAAIKLIPLVAEKCVSSRAHLWGKDINKRLDVKV
jgi:hypothetical protein